MKNDTVRLQFEISDSLAKEIARLEEDSEISSHREFFANLVGLWRWAARRSAEGKSICAIDIKTMRYNELTLPALDLLKLKASGERELSVAQMAGIRSGDSLPGHGFSPQPSPGG